ncbi:MAG TPA: hypothetical protein VLM79_07100 [Kofleriaceae bacterium]|nr:hypothetical protein [Kofleriaceae bacterium]
MGLDMTRKDIDRRAPGALGAAHLVLAGLLVGGCFGEAPPATDDESQAATADGTSTPIAQLPLADSAGPAVLGELLAKPTALGETVALHVRLPPPSNPQLAQSLVRVVGSPASPQLLFRSDTLAKLGAIKKSPGKDFFTVFTKLPAEELDKLVANASQIASGTFGETTSESVVFDGRAATARIVNPKIDPNLLRQVGVLAPVNGCFIRPLSTAAAWGKSLFITDPAIVQDPARTWDPCTGAGVPGSVWTFAHLMREMADGSGKAPEIFVREWLSMWLNDYTVNGDTVPARTAMFNQVIQPWAVAGGGSASLVPNPITGKLEVKLTRALDLDIAPFRLVAIVNRIDLGRTVNGVGGYGGSSTSLPVTAGELRFIFNVVQPSPWGGGTEASCGRKRFTTIFEYGVPGEGCDAVVAWARQWTGLAAMPGFTPAYKAQLQAMTESVVRHGAAPSKGNQNAINQIRTNEIALGPWWELREFTLTDEDPPHNVDPPSNGLLRKHTVAQTPDDRAFSAAGADPTINAFINGPVASSVPLPAANPNRCSASYTVPYFFNGLAFRGGNSIVPPGHWLANSITAASPAANICARHQFSLNTCNGCHRDDSGTNGLGGSTSFTHIDPLSPIPVRLSKFLTGGGPGLVFNVNDTQLGAPAWPFADLERRFQRLFDLSHCTACATIFTVRPEVIDDIRDMNRFVPVDINPGDPPPFEIGPVTDVTVVQKLLDVRTGVAGEPMRQPVDVIRATDVSAH